MAYIMQYQAKGILLSVEVCTEKGLLLDKQVDRAYVLKVSDN